MSSLIVLMAVVCAVPVIASLVFAAFAPRARGHRALVGALGALFGFLLGLIAVFCGVMIPLSSGGSVSPVAAGVSALVAAVLAYVVSMLMARAITRNGE